MDSISLIFFCKREIQVNHASSVALSATEIIGDKFTLIDCASVILKLTEWDISDVFLYLYIFLEVNDLS